jgi:hypothetical protein
MKTTLPSLMPAALLAAALAPAPAHASEAAVTTAPAGGGRPPFALSFDVQTDWRLDSSYRLFSRERAAASTGLTAAREVARVAGGHLAVGLGWVHEGDLAGWGGGSHQAALDVDSLALSGTLRWPVRRWFEPHVRVAADAAWAKLEVATSDGSKLDDRAWSPGGSAGAGFRLQTHVMRTALRGGRLGLAAALAVEGGFHVGSPLSFALSRTRPAGDQQASDQIPGGAISVGSFGRSQPYLRLSFTLLL